MLENNLEIVENYITQLTADGPSGSSSQSLSEDFRLIAGTVELDRKKFVAILTSLYAAIPDLSHGISNIQVRGDVIQITDHPSGTFTGHWDGSELGLPSVPPSGSAFRMAPWKWEVTVRHGKITRLHDVTVPSAASGLPGFFHALGFTLPAKKR